MIQVPEIESKESFTGYTTKISATNDDNIMQWCIFFLWIKILFLSKGVTKFTKFIQETPKAYTKKPGPYKNSLKKNT